MSKPHRAVVEHPGVILKDEFLDPLGISQNKLARHMQVPPGRINEIVKGKRAITAETAIRLGLALSTSAQFWLNLQQDYDFRLARRKLIDEEKLSIVPLQPRVV